MTVKETRYEDGLRGFTPEASDSPAGVPEQVARRVFDPQSDPSHRGWPFMDQPRQAPLPDAFNGGNTWADGEDYTPSIVR
jgi:hypothetical protein